MLTCFSLMQPFIAGPLGALGSDPRLTLMATIGHWYSSHDALQTGALHGVLNSAILGPSMADLQCDKSPNLQ